jgi:hypothetical protein
MKTYLHYVLNNTPFYHIFPVTETNVIQKFYTKFPELNKMGVNFTHLYVAETSKYYGVDSSNY